MPRRNPRAPPTSRTENVCAVIGTGEVGRVTRTSPGSTIVWPARTTCRFAVRAMTIAPMTTRATWRALVLSRSPTATGTRKSPIVIPRSAAGSRLRRSVARLMESPGRRSGGRRSAAWAESSSAAGAARGRATAAAAHHRRGRATTAVARQPPRAVAAGGQPPRAVAGDRRRSVAAERGDDVDPGCEPRRVEGRDDRQPDPADERAHRGCPGRLQTRPRTRRPGRRARPRRAARRRRRGRRRRGRGSPPRGPRAGLPGGASGPVARRTASSRTRSRTFIASVLTIPSAATRTATAASAAKSAARRSTAAPIVPAACSIDAGSSA